MAEYINIDKNVIVYDTRGGMHEVTVRHILSMNRGEFEVDDDVRPVVTCDECIHRHEMDRQSCQGRRSDFFCADGKKREES